MKLLFDNFDLLAEAPNGIKKLREMILQFAVQGKLTENETSCHTRKLFFLVFYNILTLGGKYGARL